jgi:tetratricopeptide (TPR) repeat protein
MAKAIVGYSVKGKNVNNFNFPSLTSGYCGVKRQFQTLNSTFFSEFWDTCGGIQGLLDGLAAGIQFPQRCPKTEFFNEVLRNESPEGQTRLRQHLDDLSSAAQYAVSQNPSDRHVVNVLHPLMNLLIRYGLGEKLFEFPHLEINSKLRWNYSANLEIYKNIHKSDVVGDIQFDEMVKLLNQYDQFSTVEGRLSILSRMIVTSVRFNAHLPDRDKYISIVHENIGHLMCISDLSFEDRLRWSCILRGIAMTPELAQTTVNKLMSMAHKVADGLNGQGNRIRECLKSEILATQFQSESKMAKEQSDFYLQRASIEQMIHLDPFDSTGYSELGFYWFYRSEWQKAVENFQHAVLLGPPATSMNYYFLGKSHSSLGNLQFAENSFLSSIEKDDLAVSPIIELVGLYRSLGRTDESKKWAALLLGNEDLLSQLEDDEKTEMRRVII